ncbi:MAG: cytochrome c oxidase subunit II [Cryobacterium sp.]|nr:cytochrome c oxidase subunit II [Oligoflexia bacterium]
MLNQIYTKGAGLPLQGSDVAVAWDGLYWFLFWLSVFFFVLVVGGMIYFAIVYRQREGKKAKYIVDNHLLEATWTVIPTVLLLVIFAWGWNVYKRMVQPPSDAMEVRVIGKQWLWNFQYEDGRLETNKLVVPIHKPVKLLMTSEDVLHSFFIPNFRVKSDVVPGMYTTVWFEAKVPGEHQVFCTEYCGTSHSGMLAKIEVLEPAQYELWKANKPYTLSGVRTISSDIFAARRAAGESTQLKSETIPLPEQGKKLVEAKGCTACHSADGSARIGPSYKGIFGHEAELANGEKVTVDENYISESIRKPQAKVVKGFNPVMPPYTKEMISETEMNAIIAYIKSLK